jgi:hypothetical protein
MKGEEVLIRYRPELEREYEFWMSGEHYAEEGLKRKKTGYTVCAV